MLDELEPTVLSTEAPSSCCTSDWCPGTRLLCRGSSKGSRGESCSRTISVSAAGEIAIKQSAVVVTCLGRLATRGCDPNQAKRYLPTYHLAIYKYFYSIPNAP